MRTTALHRLRVLWALWRAWRKHPCWRFGQLVANTARFGRNTGDPDPYYLKDVTLVDQLKRGFR